MTAVLKSAILLTRIVLFSATLNAVLEVGALAQGADNLPEGVNPVSRNRLPPMDVSSGTPQGAAAIRLHGSGVDVRWTSPLGRRLTELAILTTAREHDQPYEWSLHELEAIAVGLEPSVIDVIRNRKPLAGLNNKDAIIIQAGREIFGTHALSLGTYTRALELLGKSNLVDVIDLMGTYSATGARLTAFNQQMPPTWKQFLPLPFAPPDDIHQDSRSRLSLIRAQEPTGQTPPSLYSRGLAPEGTGPPQIRLHMRGLKSLEASVGRRLMDLAILVTAREHDSQYDWSINEPAALQHGLEPAIIDVVRSRKPLTGLRDKEAVIVAFGRELFGQHHVSAETYAHALKLFGETDLVGLVEVMALHSADATVLIAFDQQLPAGQKPPLSTR